MIDKVTFIGSKNRGFPVLKYIYELAPDKLHSIITINDTKSVNTTLDKYNEYSKYIGKKLHILNNPSDLETIIKQDTPKLCIVSGWYWMIKENTLNRVPNGFLGIHGSLLPKYRGGAPLVWAIINGEKESGVSLFYFEKYMDSGDIVDQKRFEIKDNDTIAEISVKYESSTSELLKDNYLLLLEGKALKVPQNQNDATYASQRRPEDSQINWNWTNIEIHNFIRAQTYPYPGAFSYFRGKKLFIWKAGVFPQDYYGIPGQVVQSGTNFVIVTCGKGAIFLYDIQVEGNPKDIASNVLTFGKRLEFKK